MGTKFRKPYGGGGKVGNLYWEEMVAKKNNFWKKKDKNKIPPSPTP